LHSAHNRRCPQCATNTPGNITHFRPLPKAEYTAPSDGIWPDLTTATLSSREPGVQLYVTAGIWRVIPFRMWYDKRPVLADSAPAKGRCSPSNARSHAW
jgi:hypothetical protein